MDLFRGMTVAGMILVNNPGSWSAIYPPLKHAKWHGCTPTDLVFPFFLFAVGASIPISFYSKVILDKWKLWFRIFTRSLILFGLGLFLNFFGEWSLGNLRIPGVLQRIAFVYWIVASFYILFPGKKILFVLIPILGIHTWLLLNVIPPGATELSLEPGKEIGAWLDREIFGEAHLWKFSKTWDPEGFFSSIPALASSIFGVFCGLILFSIFTKEFDSKKGIGGLFVCGIFLVVFGLIWDGFLPMNKSLWTGSYALFTAGLAFCCLGFFAICEERARSKNAESRILETVFQPFLVFGKNAILVFVGSGILARFFNLWTLNGSNGKTISIKTFFYSKLILVLNATDASLAYALIHLFFWWGILSFLDQRKIYFKI